MPVITLCSSVSFYQQVIEVKNELESLGFEVSVPDLAEQMEKENDYDFQSYSEKFDDTNPEVKKNLIDEHFRKIAKGDAVLIVNNMKHDLEGYIGPNVLMELTVGYFLRKTVFLLNDIERTLPAYDEIMALQPISLKGNLKGITNFLK